MKKMLEELQAEFHEDAETLATLQNIYAEKVKQIRTNRALPPDIQQRFLTEWEQFYDQRVGDIFSYNANGSHEKESDHSSHSSEPAHTEDEDPANSFGIETIAGRPPQKSRV